MIRWGTSFGSHDAALAVFHDDSLVFASHSERFSGIKDDPMICQELVDRALEFGKPSIVVHHENTIMKRARCAISGQWSDVFSPFPSTVISSLGVSAHVMHSDHHRSHAAAGYFTSGLRDASIVVMDAIGEIETMSIWKAEGTTMTRVYSERYPHSMGLLYSALVKEAGFKPNGEEYIFMGLAAHGNPSRWSEIGEATMRLLDGPGFRLHHNPHRGFGGIFRDLMPAEDIAACGQEIYQKVLHHVLDWTWKNLPSKNLVLMGGCALNCVANSLIPRWHDWNRIWIMPNPGDAGSSVGAVLSVMSTHINWPGAYLGHEIPGEYPTREALSLLISNGIVAVANGRAEFGPRALGNRSIFADPRIANIKQRMNWLKQREQFRPFAAVIPEELASSYFEMGRTRSSPYMQMVFKCRYPLSFPGIVHVDGTSRIQTVNRKQHAGLYDLLCAFREITGCPMLINTSLNIKNRPLVNSKDDAKEFSSKYGITVL